MKNLVRLPVAFAIVVCGGCCSFQEKWDATGQPGKFEHASRWDGRWTSDRHKNAAGAAEGGQLRCVIEPVAERNVVAHFRANWKAFASDYEVTFSPVTAGRAGRAGEVVEFRGTHDLPRMFGGTYRYDARIAGDHFSARYDSSYDSGKFEMTRQLTNAARIH